MPNNQILVHNQNPSTPPVSPPQGHSRCKCAVTSWTPSMPRGVFKILERVDAGPPTTMLVLFWCSFCLVWSPTIKHVQNPSPMRVPAGPWSGPLNCLTVTLNITMHGDRTRKRAREATFWVPKSLECEMLGHNQNPSSPPSCKLAVLAATGPCIRMHQPLHFGGRPSKFCVA